ncbi:MAG: 2-oxoacid:ferredoxin oxidoreductase subunit beta [Flavobacteriales bacterium]|nr:2-oxoacid:ferredoxin oxidoreductase subunit beta [Flavobacteriales bacterium]
MSYIKPLIHHPLSKQNSVGYLKSDYEGVISTLCAGCGHDSISSAIVQACYELSIEPHLLAKLSGIGCSSKTPAYFLSNSHGFNSVHGRMPSVATGANLANRDLIYLGVSGDGDTASIGMGQFTHVIRRNLNMTYIVMNNGCYGLTKGQDSATADEGSKSKSGSVNRFAAIDLVGLALELGAGFVARSFSGDKSQLIPLIKRAIQHPGFSFIDVISPCVTFNNNVGSTKSYDYVREHNEVIKISDFVPEKDEIKVEYDEGTSKKVKLHDGSDLELSKISSGYDPGDMKTALLRLQESRVNNQILTGLIYLESDSQDLHSMLDTVKTPLNKLREADLIPGKKELEEINKSFA